MARLGMFLGALERANIYDVRRRNQERLNLRQEHDAFSFLSDAEFFHTYRCTKAIASDLIEDIRPYVTYTDTLTSITVETKVLTAIGFYASGSYQRGVGNYTQHSMAQRTVSKCIKQVTDAFNSDHMLNKYIKFPQTQRDRNVLKQRFYEKFKIPVRPLEHEDRYFNRKHYHSLNAQIICDSDLNILSIDASHGGASHDSFIWQQHPINEHMERLHQDSETVWLLGDSGYPQRKWVMTPIIGAIPDSPDDHYSCLQKTARNTVERTIGVLKARWRCLLIHRVLHYQPYMAGRITNACVILHNILNNARLPVPELASVERNQDRDWQIFRTYAENFANADRSRNRLLAEGRAHRDVLVQRLWRDIARP